MIRKHITYANVTATLALVLAAGTGAVYAAGEIGSRDLANNAVRTQDLKDRRGVTGEDVKRNSIGGAEVLEEGLEGSRIVALDGAENGDCDPTTSVFIDCAAITVDVDTPSQVVALATGGFFAEAVGATLECEIRIDGADQSESAAPGETGDNTSGLATDGFSRTLATSLAPGQHTIALACQQIGTADGRVDSPTIAAVVVRD